MCFFTDNSSFAYDYYSDFWFGEDSNTTEGKLEFYTMYNLYTIYNVS